MDVDDLWIGDFVMIKSKRVIGQFEGRQGNKIIVNIGGIKMKCTLNDLDHAEDPYLKMKDETPEEVLEKKDNYNFEGNKIDLHIEVLNQNMVDALPERIRDYQIEQCMAFLIYAKKKRYATIEIIHGKGTGLLRKEIHHILKLDPGIQFILEKNDGGSTEAWIKPN